MPFIPDSVNVPPPSPAEPPRASPSQAAPPPPPPPESAPRVSEEQAAALREKLGFRRVSLRGYQVDPRQIAAQLFPGVKIDG